MIQNRKTIKINIYFKTSFLYGELDIWEKNLPNKKSVANEVMNFKRFPKPTERWIKPKITTN